MEEGKWKEEVKENGGWTKKKKIETVSEVFHISEKSKMKLSGVSFFFENTRKNFKSNNTNNNICYLNTISLQLSWRGRV